VHGKLPQDNLRSRRAAHERAVQRCQELDQQYDKHIERRPGQIAQIFNTAFSKRWNKAGTLLEAEIAQAKISHKSAAELVVTTEALMLKIAASGRAHQAAREELAFAQQHASATGVAAGAPAGTLDNQHQSCKAKATRLKQDVVQAKVALDALLREIAECRGAITDADTQIAARENAVGAFDPDERTRASWRLAQLDRDSLHRAAPYAMEALFNVRRD
jgi:chromosome segregation ATPase